MQVGVPALSAVLAMCMPVIAASAIAVFIGLFDGGCRQKKGC